MNPGTRAVCIREVQKSLEQSVMRLLEDKIAAHDVGGYFDVLGSEIRTHGDGLIIFQGMQNHTADSIKSLEGYDIAWVEEAQTLSERSLRLLRPTFRKDPSPGYPAGSELWFSWNPEDPDDPVDKMLRGTVQPPSSIVVEANWKDNPWFPKVLRDEMEYDYRVDPEAADHVWGGEYWQKSDAQVLSGKWKVEEFEPVTSGKGAWNGPYHGADWGFANDPTTLVRFWLKPDGSLMVEREAYAVGCDLIDTPRLFLTQVPDLRRYMIGADCARPETISHMSRVEKFKVEPAEKWQGSVEDGIAWLRGRPQIIIHPRCKHTILEAKAWRYKTDKLTGLVVATLIDGNDNTWDAIRYGAHRMIKVQSTYTLRYIN
jgi:phage terminase large subunit